LVYFRAGYSPKDYPSKDEWDARLLVERSGAIKCPTIGVHLVGTKKIQQVFASKKNLMHFLNEEESDKLMNVFTEIFSLEEEDSEFLKKVLENPDDYLLKPNLEGGGNLSNKIL
jgi:hypothetical protein